jgi:hypothetical protein
MQPEAGRARLQQPRSSRLAEHQFSIKFTLAKRPFAEAQLEQAYLATLRWSHQTRRIVVANRVHAKGDRCCHQQVVRRWVQEMLVGFRQPPHSLPGWNQSLKTASQRS